MIASNPLLALELVAADAVDIAEQIDRAKTTAYTTALVVAARSFKSAVEVFVERIRRSR